MRAIGRALSVLECFSASTPELSLQEISRRLGLPKSSTFRLVNSLEQLDLLVRLENQKYCLSLKICRLGDLARASLDVRHAARPIMQELASLSNESVTLFALARHEFRCLEVCAPSAPLMVLYRPGQRSPLTLGAASLVLMAYLPENALKSVLPAVARRVRHSRRELQSILAHVKQQQYAVSHGGAFAGISALSVPVFSLDANAHYSLSIVMPTVRARGRIAPLLPHLRIAGAKLSARLGASSQSRNSRTLRGRD